MAALVAQQERTEPLLIVLCGPTASGKTALALTLAERFAGEIISCDSVAVYRGMEIGTAKPTLEERARAPHHLVDILTPDQPCTAGDYLRLGREAIAGISERGRVPIVAGGTGLYLRALLDGLFAAPQRDDVLREKLRQRAAQNPQKLHRILARLDPAAAAKIHTNDTPKLIRAIEVTLAARQPITEQWQQPRDPLTGYRVLRLGLNPPRAALYDRINRRAREMFDIGLVEETTRLVERYGFDCRPLTSLGYAQALAVLRSEMTRDDAMASTAQGHRNYAKRQLTWFRKDPHVHWLAGFGFEDDVQQQVITLVKDHLQPDARKAQRLH
ncbi:MAG TPA: tRNA (adenosine(37)-N6)-dimethylallyltransferase MiaA [Acidobacteriaceae bacterium]|nr:tRNA (adenosine(37)-N6)-dimethylallyltransferase MiaA [Acidobacteriaceae bacterium]